MKLNNLVGDLSPRKALLRKADRAVLVVRGRIAKRTNSQASQQCGIHYTKSLIFDGYKASFSIAEGLNTGMRFDKKMRERSRELFGWNPPRD